MIDKFEGIREEICERISDGESLVAILRDPHMPASSTIYKLLANEPEFAEKYARAREASADADADSVKDIAMRTLGGEYDPQAARVAIDALKWSAGKRKPKVYGEKLAHEHGGPNGEAIPVSISVGFKSA